MGQKEKLGLGQATDYNYLAMVRPRQDTEGGDSGPARWGQPTQLLPSSRPVDGILWVGFPHPRPAPSSSPFRLPAPPPLPQAAPGEASSP